MGKLGGGNGGNGKIMNNPDIPGFVQMCA